MEAGNAVVFRPEATVVPPSGAPNRGASTGITVDRAGEDPEVQNFFPRRLGATRHSPIALLLLALLRQGVGVLLGPLLNSFQHVLGRVFPGRTLSHDG